MHLIDAFGECIFYIVYVMRKLRSAILVSGSKMNILKCIISQAYCPVPAFMYGAYRLKSRGLLSKSCMCLCKLFEVELQMENSLYLKGNSLTHPETCILVSLWQLSVSMYLLYGSYRSLSNIKHISSKINVN